MKVLLLCLAFAAVSMAMPVADEAKSELPVVEPIAQADVLQADAAAPIEEKEPKPAADVEKALEAKAKSSVEKIPDIVSEQVAESAAPEPEKIPEAPVTPAEEKKPEKAAVVKEVPNEQAKSAPEEPIDIKNILNSDAAIANIIPTVPEVEKKTDQTVVPQPEVKAESVPEEKKEVIPEPAKDEKLAQPKAEEKSSQEPETGSETLRVIRGADEEAKSDIEAPKEILAQPEEPAKEDAPAKVEEPAKVEKETKLEKETTVEEKAKVEESAKVEEPAKIDIVEQPKVKAPKPSENKEEDQKVEAKSIKPEESKVPEVTNPAAESKDEKPKEDDAPKAAEPTEPAKPSDAIPPAANNDIKVVEKPEKPMSDAPSLDKDESKSSEESGESIEKNSSEEV